MNSVTKYYQAANELIKKISENEQESIYKAANVLAEQIERDNLIHVFGSGGHSLMGAEELMWRAGGLVPINPIFEPGVSVQFGALRSNIIERLPGYMPAVLKVYNLKAGEALIIVNAYGINSATIDTAIEAKRLGLTTIGITGRFTADALSPDHPSRHPSGKNLYDIVDVFVNTYVPLGDAVVEHDNYAQKTSAVSTIANAFALECLVSATVDVLLQKGIDPPIWVSANSQGGDELNKKYFEKFRGRIKFLF